ncbi:hypothetical protein [Pseudonocardia nigra]|uniref:hypothetical protein n=1 Tax=Pseudonocardia nigra TaxID=1921578 RepID=UPI001C5F7E42|nr:hypothetical protein [Pseudonocardia nigra]
MVLAEILLYTQYARFDGEFHYWLHGLIGGALGLAVLTLARLTTRARPDMMATTIGVGTGAAPWEAGFLGHLYSAFPDILFLAADQPHDYWMDAFAFHITAHFIPAPIPAALALFLLALAGYTLATTPRRAPRTAAALAISTAAVTSALALSAAAPIPTDIQDLRAHPRLAWHHPDSHRCETGSDLRSRREGHE